MPGVGEHEGKIGELRGSRVVVETARKTEVQGMKGIPDVSGRGREIEIIVQRRSARCAPKTEDATRRDGSRDFIQVPQTPLHTLRYELNKVPVLGRIGSTERATPIARQAICPGRRVHLLPSFDPSSPPDTAACVGYMEDRSRDQRPVPLSPSTTSLPVPRAPSKRSST